jgi:hypothetical protein
VRLRDAADARTQAIQELAEILIGPIVHHDHLERDSLLSKDARERGAKAFAGIERRNHNGHSP